MRGTLALVLLLGACGAAPPPVAVRAPAAHDSPDPARPAWTRAPDALSARLRELTARLAPFDVRPEPTIELREFLAARSFRSFALTVHSGSCWTLVTLASGGMRDLDARVFTPDGELVAEDLSPDPRPILQLCAPDHARTLWLVLDAYDGSGGVLVGALASSRDALDPIARELGSAPGVSVEEHARGDLEEALARRGLAMTEPPMTISLDREQRVRAPLRARAGRCYAIVARSLPPLVRIELRLLDLAGAPLAMADREDGALVLQLCADQDVERALELAALDGAGQVEIAIAEGTEGEVGGHAALWLGRMPPLAAASADAPHTVLRGQLARGEAVARAVRLPAGCARVTASAGAGLPRIELQTHDPEGSAETGSALTFCSPRARTVEVTVLARSGAGDYSIGVSSIAIDTRADDAHRVAPP